MKKLARQSNSARSRLLSWAFVLVLSACGGESLKTDGVTLEPLSFDQVGGWETDSFEGVSVAFGRSCLKIQRLDPDRQMGRDGIAGTARDWHRACEKFAEVDDRDSQAVKDFFESSFKPFKVRDGREADGLFTGYFEPLLFGSRQKSARYAYPLHRKPDDLIEVNLARFGEDYGNERVLGRLEGKNLVPYYDRKDIDEGLDNFEDLAFLWVDDAVSKFFLQIQGSGQVMLEDGTVTRVGYGGQNGRPYRAIGRDLIELGEIAREDVSLQSIRAWLDSNPSRAFEIMHKNRSYVFFQEQAGLEGPLGAQNVALTPMRSLAVDRRFWPMGLPVFLTADIPFEDGLRPFSALLIAQDTGGAIRGAIRGDLFWGAGKIAEFGAGHMKSLGSMIVLLPLGAGLV